MDIVKQCKMQELLFLTWQFTDVICVVSQCSDTHLQALSQVFIITHSKNSLLYYTCLASIEKKCTNVTLALIYIMILKKIRKLIYLKDKI